MFPYFFGGAGECYIFFLNIDVSQFFLEGEGYIDFVFSRFFKDVVLSFFFEGLEGMVFSMFFFFFFFLWGFRGNGVGLGVFFDIFLDSCFFVWGWGVVWGCFFCLMILL